MSKEYTFIKEADIKREPVDGREHLWHYNPDLVQGSNIVTVKVNMPAGGSHKFHRHPRMDEVLYILKGQVEQWVKDEKQILKAGESVYIARDVVHATFNDSEEDAEFLAILTPGAGFENGTVDEYMNEPYNTYR